MGPFLQRIDPRRSLAAAIGWVTILLSMCLVLAANFWVSTIVRTTLLEQHGQRLEGTADHAASEINKALTLRLQSVSTLAAMLSDDLRRRDTRRLRQALADVRASFPDVLWMAAADADGDIVAATDDGVVGANVYQYTWMSQGLNSEWVEEGSEPGPAPAGGDAMRFLKLTAPIRDRGGAVLGVVAARLSWRWLESVVADIDASPGQWLLIDRDAQVRIGPQDFVGRPWPGTAADVRPFDPALSGLGTDASDLPVRISVRRVAATGRHYLVASAHEAEYESLDKLGWKVVVIQPAASVTAFATRVQWQIGGILVLLGATAAVLGVSLARRLTRRVRVIARSADALLAGRATQIEVPAGSDEAARLGGALDRLLAALQRERDDLRSLNAELDRRVAQRTAEIERLAVLARDAAVVRERLQMARDLHDTLAHSMMAMLTEIRLLKRLAASQPQSLPEELARAEEAAREGLQAARDAIAQMRHNPVRDIGLGAALAEVARAFRERSGLACDLQCDAAAASYAQAGAETLYRIAEEALRNVERHAGARSARLRLRNAGNGRLALEVSDDGIGFDPRVERPGHYGLVGLREQARMIGASLTIDSAPQGGTRIAVTIDTTATDGPSGVRRA